MKMIRNYIISLEERFDCKEDRNYAEPCLKIYSLIERKGTPRIHEGAHLNNFAKITKAPPGKLSGRPGLGQPE